MNVCEYGCEQEAKIYFKSTKKWCCSKSTNSCPGIKKKIKNKMKDFWSVEEREKQSKRSLSRFEDPIERKKQSELIKSYFKKDGSKEKNSKAALKRFLYETPEEKEKRIQSHINSITNEVREKQHKSAINRFKNESVEEKEKRIQAIKDSWTEEKKKNQCAKSKFIIKNSIKNINRIYPFFSFIEEMRYNPDKPGEKEIQVHCHLESCVNNKNWFTPTMDALKSRIYALEKENENDGRYFYCSQKCKENCCLFNFRNDPFEKIELDKYRDKVLKETYITTKIHNDKIKNYYLRSLKYHLDHKFSIYEGFKQDIDPKILAHHKNLEVIPIKLNLKKGSKSSITLQELLSF